MIERHRIDEDESSSVSDLIQDSRRCFLLSSVFRLLRFETPAGKTDVIIWTFAVITAKILVSMKYTSLFASNTEWIAKFPHRTCKSFNATNIKGPDPKERRFFDSVHECLYIASGQIRQTSEIDAVQVYHWLKRYLTVV